MLDRYFSAKKPSPIDELIAKVLEEMNDYGPTEPEYQPLMEKLERLNALKAQEKPSRISLDTLVLGGVQLIGVAIIVIAERNSVPSKNGLSFLSRTIK